MIRALITAAALAAWSLLSFSHSASAAPGDPQRGARQFGACAMCHSLKSGKNMTGPSLDRLWGRKAGSLASFSRYSAALKSAPVTWDDHTLDAWLKDPKDVIPGNRMTFPGIQDDQARADLLAFLRQATAPGAPSARAAQAPQRGGMMGMGGGTAPNLKSVGPGERVKAIGHCGDTYRVTRGDGEILEFWERNLRFKTDSSDEGPPKGAPAILGAGMAGDRASVIFAAPDEISAFIEPSC